MAHVALRPVRIRAAIVSAKCAERRTAIVSPPRAAREEDAFYRISQPCPFREEFRQSGWRGRWATRDHEHWQRSLPAHPRRPAANVSAQSPRRQDRKAGWLLRLGQGTIRQGA